MSRTRNLQPRMMKRVPLYHPKVPVVLLWSEKCGCTTLLKWFLFQAGLLEEALAYNPWVHAYDLEVLKTRPGYGEELVEALNSGMPAAKLVREPFRRAVSSFLTLTDKPEGAKHFGTEVRANLRQFLYGSPDIHYSFSFQQFLRWMQSVDVERLNGHIAPQYLALERGIPDLQILKLEQFKSEIRRIEQQFGLPEADIDKMSESPHHVPKANFDGARPDTIAAVQYPIPRPPKLMVPSATQFYSPETEKAVLAVYGDDFEKFGYPTELPR